MKNKLAIIHTTPVTVDSLKQLASEYLSDCEVMNIVDDSILPELGRNGGNLDEVEPRWRQYAGIAEQAGADCILNACSSVGELPSRVQPEIGIPIVRIDEAMAERAVNSPRIGVAATLETTLQPTTRLLRQKAEQLGREVEIEPLLIAAAYQKLMQGDPEGHDDELAAALEKLAARTDVVVLAQASMARVLPRFSEEEQSRFLTSPRMGMERVQQIISQKG